MGMERPKKAAPVETWSNSEYCRRAENTPIPTPMISAKKVATVPRSSVFHSASRMSLATGWLVRSDFPQSPRGKWEIQPTYCSGPDLSNPSWCRITNIFLGRSEDPR